MLSIDDLKTLPVSHDGTYWGIRRSEIRKRIINEGVGDFKNWSVIQATMHVGNAPYIATERRYAADFLDLTGLSTNEVHQAYHLARWMNATGYDLTDINNVVEVGGGYGSMCKLLLRNGINNYTLVDYPEMIYLQQHTLGNDSRVKYIDITNVDTVQPAQTLIAMWSLSESLQSERGKFTDALRKSEHVIAAFAIKWAGVDNVDYFNRMSLLVERIGHIGSYYGFR